jgi:hypothetical protein
MVRIVGILCGSAISVSVLIIALGVPELTLQPKTTPEVVANSVGQPEPNPIMETIRITESPTTVEPVLETVAEPAVEADKEPVIEPTTEMAVESPPPQSQSEHWYAFWSPFRSELAANGFVSQLQRTTGMDYRVVRLKPGVYEVAFLYEGEDDIETKLVAISAATGLEMADE